MVFSIRCRPMLWWFRFRAWHKLESHGTFPDLTRISDYVWKVFAESDGSTNPSSTPLITLLKRYNNFTLIANAAEKSAPVTEKFGLRSRGLEKLGYCVPAMGGANRTEECIPSLFSTRSSLHRFFSLVVSMSSSLWKDLKHVKPRGSLTHITLLPEPEDSFEPSFPFWLASGRLNFLNSCFRQWWLKRWKNKMECILSFPLLA